MNRGLRIARIAGIDIVLDRSLLLIFMLITLGLSAGVFPVWHPEWSAVLRWATGLGAAVMFYTPVLAHVLPHALIGRAQGIEMDEAMFRANIRNQESEDERYDQMIFGL